MDFDVIDICMRLALGLTIGFTIGLTGIGGGVLLIPSLTMLIGMSSTTAIGTASLYTFLAKIYAVIAHFRIKTIKFKIALFFLIGAIPSTINFAYLVSFYKKGRSPAEVDAFNNNLTNFIAIIMILSVALMAWNLWVKKRSQEKSKTGIDTTIAISGKSILLAIVFGIIIGGLIGSTSVGGGVILVPVLIMIFKMPTARTVGTSIFIGLILTMVTAFIYGKGGEMDHPTAIIMTMGSLVGIFAGSRLCNKIPERPLQVVVITIVCISAVLMMIEN